MKTIVLFMAMLLSGLAPVVTKAVSSQGENARYRLAQPIMFIERGIEFMIFPDGSFDFNTNVDLYQDNTNSYYYKSPSSKRTNAVNNTFGVTSTTSPVQYATPRRQNYHPTGVLVQHDSDGKVRRIGNVFINYDSQGRIKRAGTVYMSYLRGNNGLLRQVGGLRVNYNRWGEIIHLSGTVNANNNHYTYTTASQNHNQIAYGNHNDFHNDDQYYYYRKNNTIVKQQKLNP